MKNIKIGIFAGRRGNAFCNPISNMNGISVHAICESNKERREELCANFSGTNVLICETWDELMRVYKSGEFEEVLYAEAECFHATDESQSLDLAPHENHWRRFIPGTYYNMHSLGVLMTVTGTVPRRVCAMEVNTKTCRERNNVYNNKLSGNIALYEMDNGSIFPFNRVVQYESLN